MGRHGRELVVLLYVFTSLVVSVDSQGCPSPPRPFGTNHTGGDTDVFAVNAYVQYTCSFGFQAIGPTERKCGMNGTWSGSDDICNIDAPSLILACAAGLGALLIFFVASCCLLSRSRRAERRAERRLTIRQERERRAAGRAAVFDGPAAAEEGVYTPSPGTLKTKHRADRSDSGLQTDMEMDDLDLDVFEEAEDPIGSPTDNNAYDEWALE